MKRNLPQQRTRRSSEAGLTLIETTIALAVLFIAMAGIMGVGVFAIMTTENQGHLAARTTEYAQDKLEQLMSLSYGDGDPPLAVGQGSDTYSVSCVQYLVVLACTSGGSGLRVGGSTNFAAPIALYVDYLDALGAPLGVSTVAAPAGWYYMRIWKIEAPAGTTNLKKITVQCRVRYAVGDLKTRIIADATLVTYKTSPF